MPCFSTSEDSLRSSAESKCQSGYQWRIYCLPIASRRFKFRDAIRSSGCLFDSHQQLWLNLRILVLWLDFNGYCLLIASCGFNLFLCHEFTVYSIHCTIGRRWESAQVLIISFSLFVNSLAELSLIARLLGTVDILIDNLIINFFNFYFLLFI